MISAISIVVKIGKSFCDWVNNSDFYFMILQKMTELKTKKSIVIYFSRADENYGVGYIEKWNTEVIAEYIQELAWADLFKVERKTSYAKDYNTCIKEAQEEINNDERPEIVNTLESIDDYEVIYVWGPIYWWQLPQPMVTQLEKLNREWKIVRPFTTHEGAGLAWVPSQLKNLCKWAEVLEWLAIRGSSVYQAKETVENWL